MSLIDYLEQDIYWEETYKRMCTKDNFKEEQVQELVMLHLHDFKSEAIKLIKAGQYEWSIPEKHLLNKLGTSKKRVVYINSMRDRYLLGVLYRVCSEMFKSEISESCFSYKRGVRTLNAVEYLLLDESLFNKHGVKLDISSYFNSVGKEYLGHVIDELFSNDEVAYKLMNDFFMTDRCRYNGEIIEEYKGLVPGCALSSFFANYCLKDLDKHISDELGITYARYSDDIVMFDNSREKLEECLEVIKDKLKECELEINERKYEWFEPGDNIGFLGLRVFKDINNNTRIDINKNSFEKMKKKIKKSANYCRKQVELNNKDPYSMARSMFKKYNHRVFKCFIEDKSKYGWAYYAFRYINTIESIQQIDYYLKDRVRQMITGKNNSANIRKVPDEKLVELGYVSLVDMYNLFIDDFDVYCEEVYLIK